MGAEQSSQGKEGRPSFVRSKTMTSGVVTVTNRKSTPEASLNVANEHQCLQKLPMFEPLVSRASLLKTSSDSGAWLDHRPLASTLHRIDDHLRQCADAVHFDQVSLNNRLKEVDFTVSALASGVQERQKRITRSAEQLSTIGELVGISKRTLSSLQSLVESANQLNSLLPPDLQLEPLLISVGPVEELKNSKVEEASGS